MIAERRLVFESDGPNRLPTAIYVAVGEPYDIAVSDLGRAEKSAACPVHIGTADAGKTDVHGADRLQALGIALQQIDLYLNGLCAAGKLFWEDGRPYEPSEEAPYGSAFGDAIRRNLERS